MAGGPHNASPLVEDQLIRLEIEIPPLKKSMSIGMDKMRPVVEADMVCQYRNLAGVCRAGRISFSREYVRKENENSKQSHQENESGTNPSREDDNRCHDGAGTEVRSPAGKGESSPASHF